MPRRKKKQPGNFAFIDSQNLNIGVQSHGWKIDWRKFRAFLAEKYNVVNAYMFIGYLPENEDLYTQMHDAGYLVVLKPTIDMYLTPEEKAEMVKPAKEGEEPKKMQTKGNVDAELVLYAVKEMPNYNKAIIVSGDGDFFGLVEYLEQQGKLLHLMAPNRRYSSLLKPFEKHIVRVDEFKRQVAYRGFHRRPKKESSK
jgi:uncharacterized LabA/DUF88 family protein